VVVATIGTDTGQGALSIRLLPPPDLMHAPGSSPREPFNLDRLPPMRRAPLSPRPLKSSGSGSPLRVLASRLRQRTTTYNSALQIRDHSCFEMPS